jgi:glycosyltransferase XagB
VTPDWFDASPGTTLPLPAVTTEPARDGRAKPGKHARRRGDEQPGLRVADDPDGAAALVLTRPGLPPSTRHGRPSAPVVGIAPLSDDLSARRLLSRGQATTVSAVLVLAAGVVAARVVKGVGPSAMDWAQWAVAAVTVMYIAVVGFRLLLVLAAPAARVIDFSPNELWAMRETRLPVYTILVPLYREDRVVPTLIDKLRRLHYPPSRLQILLLIEEDDDQTRAALAAMSLDEQFEVLIVPPRGPRTKPKACNEGLRRARGEFCVIFDAEDRPEPDQLRKAVAAFRGLPPWVVCVQAELQYWNPWTNWLTRFFAAEYALNFSLVLRGLDRFSLPIPLGGTSNHFRTEALRQLGGWDPYNVAEDADLGMRIARRGWAVRVMASVTEEEANSKIGNWVRQRSRWTKGYFQTWLVHMRSPWRLWRDLGTRQFIGLQLTVGFATVTGLVNPVFWALTCLYLVAGPGPIAPFFPPAVLIAGLVTMLIGNLMMIQAMMAGCMARGLYRGLRTMTLVPLYWGLMSLAAYKALFQLLRPSRRHYWELTVHGLVPDPATTISARGAQGQS